MCRRKSVRNCLDNCSVRPLERGRFQKLNARCFRLSHTVTTQTLRRGQTELRDQRDEVDSAHPPDVEHNNQRPNVSFAIQDQQKSLSHTCLTRPVLLTIASYGTLVFLETCIWMFLPLVYTTPTQLGGLGLDPIRMGFCMAVWGILRGVLQLTVFHRILNFLGLRRTYIALLSGLVPSFLLFPINGTRVQYAGTDIVLWALVLIQLVCSIGVCMAYGTQRPLS